MHPITSQDKKALWKYNLKHNLSKLSAMLSGDKNYWLSWVAGNSVFMRKGATDILVFKKVFIEGEYKFSFQQAPKTIIDAGANVGMSAIYFAQRFPEAKIIAIEPESSNFELLQKNTKAYSNIVPLHGALGRFDGHFKILNKDGDNWNFKIERSTDDQSDGIMYSITSLMKNHQWTTIDFLKIDIEGGETDLFQQDTEWLLCVKKMSIELHDFIIPHSSNHFFSALVKHQPFNFLTLGENHLIEFNR